MSDPAKISLSQQIEGYTQALVLLIAKGKHERHHAALDAVFVTLRWLADCEESLRAYLATAEAPARGRAPDAPQKSLGINAQILAYSECIPAMSDLVCRGNVSASQRHYLAQRLEAVMATLCWLSNNERRVRAYVAATKVQVTS